MRIGPPLIDGIDPELKSWLTDLYAAFSQGQGFPARFQMGENFKLAGTVQPGAVFHTARSGAPATHTDLDNDPVGSTYSRTDGAANTSFYVKEAAGAGGWAAK